MSADRPPLFHVTYRLAGTPQRLTAIVPARTPAQAFDRVTALYPGASPLRAHRWPRSTRRTA